MSEPQMRRSSLPAAEEVEAVEGERRRADDQHDHLHRVVVGDRAHPAERGVEPGQHDHQHRADPEGVEVERAEVERELRQQRPEHHAAREDADGDLGHDERDDRDDRQHVARLLVEAPLQELRHREDLRAHVERHEHPRQHQQAPGVQLVVRERDTVGRAGSGEADDVLGADVRREDRGADHPPAEVAAGEEVVVGRLLLVVDHPPGDAAEDAEVDGDHRPVDAGDVAGDREQRNDCAHAGASRSILMSRQRGTMGQARLPARAREP